MDKLTTFATVARIEEKLDHHTETSKATTTTSKALKKKWWSGVGVLSPWVVAQTTRGFRKPRNSVLHCSQWRGGNMSPPKQYESGTQAPRNWSNRVPLRHLERRTRHRRAWETRLENGGTPKDTTTPWECYVGGVEDGQPVDTMTPIQEAVFELVKKLRDVFGLLSIHGHREFVAKACPCRSREVGRNIHPTRTCRGVINDTTATAKGANTASNDASPNTLTHNTRTSCGASAGGARTSMREAVLKETGYKKGFPDVFIYEPRGGHHGLSIELKREKGGRVSASQKEWKERLRRVGTSQRWPKATTRPKKSSKSTGEPA